MYERIAYILVKRGCTQCSKNGSALLQSFQSVRHRTFKAWSDGKRICVLLKSRTVSIWSARHLQPGTDRLKHLYHHLDHADLIVLLLSADFFTVVVQPLSQTQLDAVLVQAGKPYSELRGELKENADLAELARFKCVIHIAAVPQKG
jgi:hypothetical protein